ncbi:MAG: hypothetical protein R2752_14420 [Vicinamibacterales bacterium]
MRARLRPLAGPLIIGVSGWCAAGAMTVADAAGASARLAVPAPWWLFVGLTAGAALVAPWRRAPRTALPALAATLPWWPVPLPAVALIFTGPLAWLPVLLALGVATGDAIAGGLRRLLPATAGSPSRAVTVAVILTLLAGGLSLGLTGSRLRGDEPHYLMITQSLLADGDLRIENNHDNREYADFYRDGRLVPDFTVRGQSGEIYSIHAPGTPVLVLPAYAAFGWRGAQLFLLLLSAGTGGFVWWIGWRATGDASAAWFAWAAVALSATFLLHASAIFPDAPAAFIVAATIVVSLAIGRGAPVRTRTLVAAGAGLAALPWLHSRLVVLACGLGALLTWQILRGPGTPGARRRQVAVLLAAPLVSAMLWFAFFDLIYGVPDPRAPYGGDDEARLGWIAQGILGLLFDQQFGMMAHAPVLAVALVGFVRPVAAPVRRTMWGAAAAVLGYLAVVTLFRMWWAGLPSAPARFLVAVAPLLALPSAIAWHTADRAGRALLRLLLAVSVGVAALLIASRGALAWNVRDAQALWLEWLSPVTNLPRIFPSFFWAGDAAFVGHVAVAGSVCAGLWLLARRAGAGRDWSPGDWRLATATWLLASLFVLGPAGWAMTRSSPLDPARSQLAVAADLGEGRDTVTIRPFRVSRARAEAPGLVIHPEQLGTYREQVQVLVFPRVPPGLYRLQVGDVGEGTNSGPGAPGERDARNETVTLTVGTSPAPLRTFEPGALGGAGRDVDLAGGAEPLVLGALSDQVNMIGWPVTLTPMALGSGTPATRTARLGDVDVFVRDEAVFLEPAGFWVPGTSTASVAFSTPPDGTPLRLTVQNGAAANTVTIASGDWRWTADLEPDASRPVEIPVPSPVGARVTFSCTSGFRPSDVGSSADTRNLGVWVTIQSTDK